MLLFVFDGTSDDADVSDARLLDGVHDRSEGSEGYTFVSAKIDDTFCRIAFACSAETRRELIDVDGLVLQEDVLIVIDGDDHPLISDLVDGTGLRNRNVDTGLQDWCGQHEDEEKHQDDVDEGSDVDLGECSLRASFCAEGHG